MNDLRQDGFLDGRLRIWQPLNGYRSGADAVMMAAACPALPGQTVLELGCGAGVASLCLGWRIAGLSLTGVERDPATADLARRNATANDIALMVATADLACLPPQLREQGFDHVMANPPYFLGGTRPAHPGRALARREATPLSVWVDIALRRLRQGGTLTLIQRADRLDGVIASLAGRAGAITVLPIAARYGRDAGRVIVQTQKGARGPLRLLAPFIMHEGSEHFSDREDLTATARAILREGQPMSLGNAKVP